MRRLRLVAMLLVTLAFAVALSACVVTAPPTVGTTAPAAPTIAPVEAAPVAGQPVSEAEPAKAKYIFVFIGDGMGIAQRNAAELYLATTTGADARPEETRLVMNSLPVQGANTTYDLTSVIPDSASTATAIASGIKTASGVLNMDADGVETYTTIAEVAHQAGWKVGIMSTVSLDHATPAAFYAHQVSRRNMYEIGIELANSSFDFFAGGQLLRHAGADGQPDVLDVARENGYTIVDVASAADLEALTADSGKVLAMDTNVDDDAAMQYAIDREGTGATLADYVRAGINVLNNPTGFFMMVEGGKIDWACHANDIAASIGDVVELDAAIAEALAFYSENPQETLIVVTGDHETGGLTIGDAGTGYASYLTLIGNQTMSYIGFDALLAEYRDAHAAAGDGAFADMLPLIEEHFGLVVTDDAENPLALGELDLAVLEAAFVETIKPAEERADDDATYLHYGGYEPLTIKCSTILDQKAGIGWTTYSHTGVPVITSAIGAGAEQFDGYYDQDDIHTFLMTAAGF